VDSVLQEIVDVKPTKTKTLNSSKPNLKSYILYKRWNPRETRCRWSDSIIKRWIQDAKFRARGNFIWSHFYRLSPCLPNCFDKPNLL